jgi:hypothetical protein
MRVTSVQLGGSLAGKLSSKLSSILSSDVAAAGGSGWRLRRATADPCRCCAMERGLMSPADSRHSHRNVRSTRPTRRGRAYDTPSARAGTRSANAVAPAQLASTDPRWARFEVNTLSRRLTSPRLVRRPQPIADAGLRQNTVRALGIGFDLLPELTYIDAQVLCVGEVVPQFAE